jgi:NAD(P)-dependent dehydrogenase (short-subunit alcohol dehydrogenase family)
VREALEGGYRRFGALHIVYNNAGVLWRDRDLSVVDTPRENWDRVIAINLSGPYLVCKYAVPKLIAGGGGAILNIGSISAVVGFTRPQDAYTSAKGGLIALTKSLAVQYAKDHIRANIIHPGFIDTPMQAKELEDPAFVKAVEESIPLGRIGQPSDIARAALFLCSDEASWVTGAELSSTAASSPRAERGSTGWTMSDQCRTASVAGVLARRPPAPSRREPRRVGVPAVRRPQRHLSPALPASRDGERRPAG